MQVQDVNHYLNFISYHGTLRNLNTDASRVKILLKQWKFCRFSNSFIIFFFQALFNRDTVWIVIL